MFAAAAALVAALFAIGAAPARADYGQVANFAQSGEVAQLQNATAMAVNVAGAGGVEAGSLYVVGRNNRVLRFGPGKEGEEPQFREAWGWGVGDGAGEFERCGPAYVAEPRPPHTFATCTPVDPNVFVFGGEESGHFEKPGGVAVDQATGDVYVLNIPNRGHREHHLIEVFSAGGAQIENGSGEDGFGDMGRELPAPAESIAEGPEKLHEMGAAISGIAVDEAGTVYVTDFDYPEIANPPGEARVMCFEPEHPGEYEHYAYCGQGRDITIARSQTFTRIALVGGGRLVTAGAERIREYALSSGGQPQSSTPICSYLVPEGQLAAMTANPATGEVFYFSPKNKKVHRLGACNAGTGLFGEDQGMAAAPETKGMEALAVNPALAWSALRPAGVLYGADGEEHSTLHLHGSGDVFAPAQGKPPKVVSESVTGTGTASSTLRAEIDPQGHTTHYTFQYLSQAEYEADGESFEGPSRPQEAPLGGGQIPGTGVGIATAAISGLSPGTEYVFRVLAENECKGPGEPLCEATGKATAFATYPTATLGPPDGRSYELVSPAQKSGGEVFPADPRLSSCVDCKPPGIVLSGRFPMQSAPGGEAVVYEGQPFSPTEGAAFLNEYVSRRTASGWQTTALSPAQQNKEPPQGTLAFDSGLGDGLIYQVTPSLAPAAPAGYANLYLQGNESPAALSPLLTKAMFPEGHPPGRTEAGFTLQYAGHSADFGRQFFAANSALVHEVPGIGVLPDPGSTGRDLYESHAGQLALVNVAPGNGSVLTGATFASRSPNAHAISESGRRAFFEAGGRLYVREDGQVTREVTQPGSFLTASADGLEVLLSDGCLYSLTAESCEDLTEFAGHHEGGFLGIAGIGEEGGEISSLYFVDSAVLAENEGPALDAEGNPEKAQAGKDNLYAWRPGGQPRFIARLLATDNGSLVSGAADWTADPAKRTAEASPDGRWLAFVSQAPLTGYGNVGPTCERNSVEEFVTSPCLEVFLYDTATGRLACPSCNPTGETPLGPSTLRRIAGAEEWLPQPRYLTDSGRLYFDSQDRLSPLDANGRVEDVYEFEPTGIGSCTRPGGCVSLISPGTGSVDSNFLAMDETGKNVFFTTRERLVPQDHDELIDLYDAREGGGFGAEGEIEAGPCSGEACQPQVPTPTAQAPGSAGFQGPGNVVEKHQKKKKHKHKKKRPGSHGRKHGGTK